MTTPGSEHSRPEPSSSRGRIARLVAGWSLLVLGGALLVLPGPGLPLVLGGLVLLSREHAWAYRMEQRVRGGWERARARMSGRPSA